MDWISQAAAARKLQIPKQKITKWINSGLLKKRKSDSKIKFSEIIKIYEQGQILNKNNGTFNDLSEARLAFESWRAKMAELEYLERKGELGEIKDFIFYGKNIVEVSKSKLYAAMDRLPPLIKGEENEKRIRKIIRDVFNDALNELDKLSTYK